MGHQISKQQNQQMSDDQQMTNSIDARTESSTSAKDLHAKLGKNRRIASNTKKLKKQTVQRRDVNSIEANNLAKTAANTIATVAPQAISSPSATINQERNAGSVVITIRLLKMESARSIGVNSIDGGDDIHNDNYSNNNCPPNRSQLMNSASELKTNDCSQNHVNGSENSIQNQNNSFKLDNNNMHVKQSELIKNNRVNVDNRNIVTNFMQCDNGNNSNSGQNSFKKQHQIHRALHSEATICDNVQINGTSQSIDETTSIDVNRLTHPLTTISLTEPTTVLTMNNRLANDSMPITKLNSKHQPNAFIPTNLIGTVSPYPHHIPIANIIRSDCLNAVTDEHSTQFQYNRKDGSSSVSNIGNGNGSKPNSASKESKEIKSKKPNWGIKLNCTKLKGIKALSSSLSSSESVSTSAAAQKPATSNDMVHSSAEIPSTTTTGVQAQPPAALLCTSGGNVIIITTDQPQPWFALNQYSIDCDKKARYESNETTPGFISTSDLQTLHSMSTSNLQLLPSSMTTSTVDASGKNVMATKTSANSSNVMMLCSNDPALRNWLPILQSDMPRITEDLNKIRIHSQVDYVHCLVPDLMQITNCSFYWGKMDRYEAERRLENKPEGTFLLRDSAQEEFLFSVSFRKYGRSLHARIEQLNHQFSFDSHDQGVFTSKTVTGLLEHYNDPGCVMFFEPALSIPLNRNFVFSLQQLCRATIVSNTTYDGINDMCLPKKLKSYLKEYHYKHHVRSRLLDDQIYGTSQACILCLHFDNRTKENLFKTTLCFTPLDPNSFYNYYYYNLIIR